MPAISLSGRLPYPDGSPMGAALILFVASRTSDGVLEGAKASFSTDYQGNYRFDLEYGTYDVFAQPDNTRNWYQLASDLRVGASTTETSLTALIEANQTNVDDTSPEVVLEIKRLRNEAAGARDQSQRWASAPSGEVIQGGLMSARAYAEEAKNATLAAGAMVYRGEWSAASGVYPTAPAQGHYYVVSQGGTVGGVEYKPTDQVVYTGSEWKRFKGNYWTVASVGGYGGAVTDNQLLEAIKRVDGPESGLNAELLNGSRLVDIAADYEAKAKAEGAKALQAAKAYTDTQINGVSISDVDFKQKMLALDGPNSGLTAQYLGESSQADIFNAISAAESSAAESASTYTDSRVAPKLNKSEFTAANVLAMLKLVDGENSGLDAGLLAGKDRLTIESEYKAAIRAAEDRANAYADSLAISSGPGTETLTPNEILARLKTVDGANSGLDAGLLGGLPLSQIQQNYETAASAAETNAKTHADTKVDSLFQSLVKESPVSLRTFKAVAGALNNNPSFAADITAEVARKVDTSSFTGSNLLSKLSAVDGADSGLDADKVDGKHLTQIEADYVAKIQAAEQRAKKYADSSAGSGAGTSPGVYPSKTTTRTVVDNGILDVSQYSTFVINNDRDIALALVGETEEVNTGNRVRIFLRGTAPVSWPAMVFWSTGRPAPSLGWAMIDLEYEPTLGWFGTYWPTEYGATAGVTIRLAANEVEENVLGAVVGPVTVSGSGSYTLSVSDTRFEIASGILKLKDNQRVLYKDGAYLDMDLIATNDSGTSISQNVSVSVKKEIFQPTAITLSNTQVDENTLGAVVGTVSVEDPDSTSHALEVSDARFEFEGNVLQLKSDQSLDYATEQGVALSITATDPTGLFLTQEFTLSVVEDLPAPPAPAPDNLLTDAYVGDLESTAWENVTGGTQVEYGVPDSAGNLYASDITFVGNTDNHLYQELAAKLTEGATYIGTAEVKPGATYVGNFEISYYDDATLVNRTEVPLSDGWQVAEYVFEAGAAPNNIPRFRLIGWGNGGDGNQITLGKAELKLLANPLPDNVLSTDFLSKGSDWKWTTAGVDVAYAQPDANGDPLATKITFLPDNHHLWYDLDTPLEPGAVYEIRAEVAPAAEGYTGSFQMAYYGDTGAVVEDNKTLTAGWNTQVFSFQVPSVVSKPSIRLVGASGGLDGEGLLLRQLSLVRTKASSENAAPTGIALSANEVVSESPGAEVGTITVSDADDASHTLSVDDVRFEIVGDLLKLKTGQSVTPADEPLSVTITATDTASNQYSETLALTVKVIYPAPPAPGPDNLLDAAYIYDLSTGWDNVTNQSTVEYGFPDPSGNNYASEVTFIGPDNNHVYNRMSSSLIEGATYQARAEVRPGDTGYTGVFQVAYYDGGTAVNDTETTLVTGWQNLDLVFTAGASPLNDPSLRLVGWGNGADGESVRLAKVVLRKIADPVVGNLFSTDFITEGSDWQNSSSGSTFTYNQPDANGDLVAAKIDFIGSSSHVWQDLASPLVAGNTYRVTVEVAPGAEGYTGGFQIAYYDNKDNLTSVSRAVTAGWQTLTYEFTAPAAPQALPSIRLVGFGNPAVGDSILIRQATIVDITP